MARFDLITDRKEIRAAQKALEDVLDDALPIRPGTYIIGHQGGNNEAYTLRANARIWHHRQVIRNFGTPRFWNAFGLASQLSTKRSNNITVEINSPLSGSSGAIAGMFAREAGGGLALLHSGKVGGGRPGIGKSEFIRSLGAKLVPVFDDDRPSSERSVLLVARFDDPHSIRGIEAFVLAVARFKDRNSTDNLDTWTMKKLKAKALAAQSKPRRTLQEVVVFYRSPHIAAYAKRRANGYCDLCGKKAPFDVNGAPFLECHHIDRLADNGEDSIFNTVALCPNCHRRTHMAFTNADITHLRRKAAR